MIDQKTRDKIAKRIRELTHGFEVGKSYKFNFHGRTVERTITEIGDQFIWYLRNGIVTKCSIATFKRLYDDHGAKET